MLRSPFAKGDLETYLHAAKLIIGDGEVYSTPSQGGLYYAYPPILAILFYPLTFVPVPVTIVMWTMLNVFLGLWVVRAFYEAMAGPQFLMLTSSEQWVLRFFPILLSSRFILHNLSYGQANILVLALAVLGLKFIKKADKNVIGGAVIGASVVIKIITFPLTVWFFTARSSKVLAGILIGVIATGLILPALILGFSNNWQYLSLWLQNSILFDPLANQLKLSLGFNVSLHAQLYRFFSDPVSFEYAAKPYYLTIINLPKETIRTIGYLIPLTIISALVFYRIRYQRCAELVSHWGGVALTFSLIPLFTPTAQKHHFVMLLPAYVYSVYVWHCLGLRDRWFRVLVVASVVLATLTTEGIWGKMLGDVFAALGCIAWGTLLLAAAIFRAAGCLNSISENSSSSTSTTKEVMREQKSEQLVPLVMG